MKWFIDFYWQLRVLPYAVKHLLGRWYVLRDAPDGVVFWLAKAHREALRDELAQDDDVMSFLAEGTRELEVRVQRLRRKIERLGGKQ